MITNKISAMNWNTITFEMEGSFGLITINRESKLNALNTEVLSELKELLQEISKDEEFHIKGLMLTGSGEKAFIAGADILEMSEMNPSDAFTLGQLGQQVTLLFEKLSIPVVAMVNGYALGGGCEMAMGADFIFATENAVFGLPEVKLGLIPGFGGTQRLSKIVGRNVAKEMIFTGRNMLAHEAFEKGLVLQLFKSKAEMKAHAVKTLETIALNSPFAVATVKKVMNEGADLTIQEGLQLEKRQFSTIFTSLDMKEGTKAFVEKRKPIFKGE